MSTLRPFLSAVFYVSFVTGLGCSSAVEVTAAPPKPLACVASLAPRPLPPFSPDALCEAESGFASPSVLAFTGSDLVGVFPDGEIQVLHAFFPDLAVTHRVSRTAVLSRGQLVAAAAVAMPIDDKSPDVASVEIVLLDLEGALLNRQRFDAPYENWGESLALTGNERGLFACGYRFGDTINTIVFDASGDASAQLDGVLPITDPDARGYIAVQDERDSPDRPVSWLNPCTLEREPARRNELSSGGSMALGSALIHYDVTANELVREQRDDEARFPLDPTTAYWLDEHPAGWVLFATDDPARLFAVNARTGEQRSFSIKLPDGFRRYDSIPGPGFDGAAREIHVTSDGRIELPLRNDAQGRLFVTADGLDWEKLGAPIGKVYRAYAAEAGGTYLHFGSDFAVSLPPWSPLPNGEARIDGTSLQMLQAGTSTGGPIDASNTRYVHLSPDGGCASYAIGDTLLRVRAGTMVKTSVVLGKDEYWDLYSTFTWVGGDDVLFLPQ